MDAWTSAGHFENLVAHLFHNCALVAEKIDGVLSPCILEMFNKFDGERIRFHARILVQSRWSAALGFDTSSVETMRYLPQVESG